MLPDPDRDPQFYDGVRPRRLVAWIIDLVASVGVTALVLFVLAIPTLGFILLWAVLLWWLCDMALRAIGLRVWSATLGMKVMGVELRDASGDRLAGLTAFVHTGAYAVCIGSGVLQLGNLILMGLGRVGRSGPDLLCGTTMINRPL